MNKMCDCKICLDLERKINCSQARRDHKVTRHLYSQWNNHIRECHANIEHLRETEWRELGLVRQLWPGANVSETV